MVSVLTLMCRWEDIFPFSRARKVFVVLTATTGRHGANGVVFPFRVVSTATVALGSARWNRHGYRRRCSLRPSYCHVPKYSEEYFKQIPAEQLATKLVKGYRRHAWQKMRERNEALDCRVYARAAAERIGSRPPGGPKLRVRPVVCACTQDRA